MKYNYHKLSFQLAIALMAVSSAIANGFKRYGSDKITKILSLIDEQILKSQSPAKSAFER